MTVNTKLMALAAALGLAGCMNVERAVREAPPQSVFQEGTAYDASGTVVRVEGNKVTLAREGLPPMKLMVENNTLVTLNGYQSSLRAIPEGGVVRAKFQVIEDRAIAVRLDVNSRESGMSQPRQPMTPAQPQPVEPQPNPNEQPINP